jgi:hypothetical protein
MADTNISDVVTMVRIPEISRGNEKCRTIDSINLELIQLKETKRMLKGRNPSELSTSEKWMLENYDKLKSDLTKEMKKLESENQPKCTPRKWCMGILFGVLFQSLWPYSFFSCYLICFSTTALYFNNQTGFSLFKFSRFLA